MSIARRASISAGESPNGIRSSAKVAAYMLSAGLEKWPAGVWNLGVLGDRPGFSLAPPVRRPGTAAAVTPALHVSLPGSAFVLTTGAT